MANWSDLLQSRDLNATLPAVLQHLDLELRSPTPLGPLAQAIAAAVKRPGGALLGLSTLLAALELQFPKEVEAPLLSEAVVKGVVGCTGSPLVAALAVRCLCSLVVASQKHQGSKEERMEKQSWMRKAIPQIKEALEAHPKSFQVQQAVAEGCCALLMDGGNFGGHMASLWHTLWPLLVHPKPSVAQPAGLALCRMTWLARNEEVPTAEKAMEQACTELYQVHQQLASPGAALQCRRLVEFLQVLLLYSRSRPAELARRERQAEEALAVLPMAKLMGVVDRIMNLLRETETVEEVISNQVPPGELLWLLEETLELTCVLVDLAGAALLVFAGQVRRWLELLTEHSVRSHGRHGAKVFRVLSRLELRCPAVLLKPSLLTRLCQYALDAMSANEVPSRKRKAELMERDGPSDSGLFAEGGRTLARLVDLGAPILPQATTASICEQVVQAVWHGLLRGAGSVSGKDLEKCWLYRRVCRDPESVLSLLKLIHVLHRPRGVPLAPSLTHAFAALVGVLQEALESRVPPMDEASAADSEVRLRLREVSDDLRQRAGPILREGIGIVWPDAREAEAPAVDQGPQETTEPQEQTPPEPTPPQLAPPEPAPVEPEAESTPEAAPPAEPKELAESHEAKDPEPVELAVPVVSEPDETSQAETQLEKLETKPEERPADVEVLDVEMTPRSDAGAEQYFTPRAEKEETLPLFPAGDSPSPELCLDSPSD